MIVAAIVIVMLMSDEGATKNRSKLNVRWRGDDGRHGRLLLLLLLLLYVIRILICATSCSTKRVRILNPGTCLPGSSRRLRQRRRSCDTTRSRRRSNLPKLMIRSLNLNHRVDRRRGVRVSP